MAKQRNSEKRRVPSSPQANCTRSKDLNAAVVIGTVGDLLDRYAVDVIPSKAITTQDSNAFAIVQLKKVLGELLIPELTLQSVTEYFSQRSYKVAARREIEVLSHAYTKAVEWGYIGRHPFKGMLSLPKEEPRRRHVEDWEVLEMLSLEPRQKTGSVRAIQSFIRLMLLTGLRRVELLRVKVTSIQDDGFEVDIGKSGKRVTFRWTDELRTAISLAKNSRPAEMSAWLFCKADGTCYVNEENGRADGWDSMWGRFVDRILLETKIVKRFTEHDLRLRAAFRLSRGQHPPSIAALARAHITAHQNRADRIGTVCVGEDGRQFTPISPHILADAPVAEFVSSSNGLPIHQKKRKAQISLATPAWADRELIKTLYETARAYTRQSGKLHVVDHIVPLHHPLVCGLHVPANMRVVLERINAAKHNRFDPSEDELIAAEPASTTPQSLPKGGLLPGAPAKKTSHLGAE
jgi:integrase